jgi:hypothetical protein
MAFEIASTNLVIELGIILALLMGWQFTAAEFVGGPIMIVVVAVLFRMFVRQRVVAAAREQADRAGPGRWRGTQPWICPSRPTGLWRAGFCPPMA